MRPEIGLAALIAPLALGACSDPVPSADVVELPTINVSTDHDTQPPAAVLAPLTPDGWGALTIGMTLDQVIAAAGPDADPAATGGPDPQSCDQFRPANTPDGLLVMIENGRLTRISLSGESPVRTDPGLRLGATPDAIRAAYADRVETTPHKYEDAPAAYMDVWSNVENGAAAASDPDARGVRYVIGSNGRTQAIHAGGPSILYVEGCL